MVCVKTSLDFSNIDVALHASSNLEVLGIAVHGFSIFNIYNCSRHIFNGLYILNVDLIKKKQNPDIKQQDEEC